MSAPAGDVPTESVPSGTDSAADTWVTGLTGTAPEREATIRRLHEVLVRIARGEARRRAGLHGIAGPELDDLADQAADDALVSILRRVDEFRGESRFTTWAYKFVVLEVSTKFSRHAWRRARVQLDEEAWDRLPANLGADPEHLSESRELVGAVHAAVDDVLTAHQRRVFVALVLEAKPLDVLVEDLGSNRNAVYKTMFDARRKLRQHLVERGHLAPTEGRG